MILVPSFLYYYHYYFITITHYYIHFYISDNNYFLWQGTVSSELRVLESRKQQLQMDVVEYGNKIKILKQELQRQQAEMERLKISLEQVC